MEKLIADENIHVGHRERMRRKLLQHGRAIFDTYELLEMLLYFSVPYRDTNPIAKRLLYAFGGLDGVLVADRDELTQISGIGERTADMLSQLNRLSDIIGAEILLEGNQSFSSYGEVGEYFTDYFRNVEKKCVVAMFLDSSMRLLKLKKLYDLDFESGAVRPKPFIDEAVLSNAAVVISAHNHPYSSCFPTSSDRETNLAITDALSAAGFVHAEHYVVSGDYYMGINSHKRFCQSGLSSMPEVFKFAASCADEEITSRCNREPRELILPDEIYNKADAEYFKALLGFADARQGEKRAIALLKQYGTIENILTASVDEICRLVGERMTCFIKLLSHIISRRVTEKFKFGERATSVQIADYLKGLFLGESVEKIYLLCFDSEQRITGCHLLAEGTVISSDVLPRKAVEKAVSSSAKYVALAHNHPFGSTRPSSDDINITAHLAAIFESCDIRLIEHYITAGQLCGTVEFQK